MIPQRVLTMTFLMIDAISHLGAMIREEYLLHYSEHLVPDMDSIVWEMAIEIALAYKWPDRVIGSPNSQIAQESMLQAIDLAIKARTAIFESDEYWNWDPKERSIDAQIKLLKCIGIASIRDLLHRQYPDSWKSKTHPAWLAWNAAHEEADRITD